MLFLTNHLFIIPYRQRDVKMQVTTYEVFVVLVFFASILFDRSSRKNEAAPTFLHCFAIATSRNL
jgi:hypothetical protein